MTTDPLYRWCSIGEWIGPIMKRWKVALIACIPFLRSSDRQPRRKVIGRVTGIPRREKAVKWIGLGQAKANTASRAHAPSHENHFPIGLQDVITSTLRAPWWNLTGSKYTDLIADGNSAERSIGLAWLNSPLSAATLAIALAAQLSSHPSFLRVALSSGKNSLASM